MCDKKTFFDILAKGLISIIDINGNMLYGDFKIINFIDKHSSLKKSSYRITLNGIVISNVKKCKVIYKCYTCGHINTINMKKYLIKTTYNCIKCSQTDEKSKQQSETLKKFYNCEKNIKTKHLLSNIDNILSSKNDFNSESEHFKNEFFNKHITKQEFNTLLPYMVSINNYIINNTFIFIDIIKTNNQMKYSQAIYDTEHDIIIPFKNIKYKCTMCGVVFNTTRLQKTKIGKDIKCKLCSSSVDKYKHKLTHNILGDNVTYQSKPEYKLIEFCNVNNIVIVNGNRILYDFNNQKQRYYVDFYLPTLKYLIEIKDNHIWHKQQVSSGKWYAKENAAIEYCKLNDLDFKLIFVKELNNFLSNLLIDSQNIT